MCGSWLWIFPLAPLVGAVVLLCTKVIPARLAGVWATGIVAALAAFAWKFAFSHYGAQVGQAAISTTGRSCHLPIRSPGWEWIEGVSVNLQLDSLSLVMVLLVTTVGALIHLFAIGYMAHDSARERFFGYLNLFVASMLLLVLGSSLPVLFIGWEGVGVCSFLLIGFWRENAAYASAATKAFVLNRIGDAGLVAGMAVLWIVTGTLDFSLLAESAASALESWGYGVPIFVALALFVGVCGKSAQLPLSTWLPDAMAGPTPVSALIHAATMVTAGVYLMARMPWLFAAYPEVVTVTVFIGIVTSVVAGLTALGQSDIKKVLAYSTVSQLGIMVAAAGAGAWPLAIFHVLTHAFFKATLFLGAGSVIHGVHGEQDMRNMGGLLTKMPITAGCWIVAVLAISAVAPFAGYYSKHEIFDWLLGTKMVAPWLLTGISVLTATYMARAVSMVFFGKSRVAADVHPHEAPVVMWVPVLVLAVLSVVGGLWLHDRLPVFLGVVPSASGQGATGLSLLLASIPGLIGCALGFLLGQLPAGQRLQAVAPLREGLYVDWLQHATIKRTHQMLASAFTSIERIVFEGGASGVGATIEATAESLRVLHTGRLGTYLASIVLAAAIFVGVYVLG